MKSSYQEESETRGVRANNAVEFAVLREGKRWYDLLALLEEIAVTGNNFALIKRAVNHADEIRESLKGQGF